MLKMLMFLLTVTLPFALTFEENQWIKEWPLLLDNDGYFKNGNARKFHFAKKKKKKNNSKS